MFGGANTDKMDNISVNLSDTTDSEYNTSDSESNTSDNIDKDDDISYDDDVDYNEEDEYMNTDSMERQRKQRELTPEEIENNELYKSFVEKIMKLKNVDTDEAKTIRSIIKIEILKRNPELAEKRTMQRKIKQWLKFYQVRQN